MKAKITQPRNIMLNIMKKEKKAIMTTKTIITKNTNTFIFMHMNTTITNMAVMKDMLAMKVMAEVDMATHTKDINLMRMLDTNMKEESMMRTAMVHMQNTILIMAITINMINITVQKVIMQVSIIMEKDMAIHMRNTNMHMQSISI